MRARGMGSRVIVCEVDPIRALEARMDGYDVMRLEDAIRLADIVLSTTGNKHVINHKHFKVAKDEVILANSGHFDVEINKDALKKLAKRIKKVRPLIEEYDLKKEDLSSCRGKTRQSFGCRWTSGLCYGYEFCWTGISLGIHLAA